jgi:hypothetical protein
MLQERGLGISSKGKEMKVGVRNNVERNAEMSGVDLSRPSIIQGLAMQYS